MDTIIRNVRDIEMSDRRALEHVLGRLLHENHQVIIQVVTVEPCADNGKQGVSSSGPLPDWCQVYAGLSDEQVAEIEEIALQRAELSRPSE